MSGYGIPESAFLVAVFPQGWETVLLLGLLGGILALDDTALAQTWFGQPLASGILAGLICGDPWTGLAIGLPLQLVLLNNLPIGQTFTGDHVTGVVSVVGAAACGDRALTSGLLHGSVEALAWPDWLMIAAVVISLAGHFLIQAERRAHGDWMRAGHLSLRDGSLGRLDRIHLRCLLVTMLRGMVMTVLFLALVRSLWMPLFDRLAPAVLQAVGMLPILLPGLGLGALWDRFGWRSSWGWVLAGAAGGWLLGKVVVF